VAQILQYAPTIQVPIARLCFPFIIIIFIIIIVIIAVVVVIKMQEHILFTKRATYALSK